MQLFSKGHNSKDITLIRKNTDELFFHEDYIYELSNLAWTAHITKTCLFKYIEHFISKNGKISDKKLRYLSYFYSKHRLWVLVRTASTRQF